MEIKWIFEISFVLVSTVLFSLENKNCFVHGVHLNKKIQNLSIESSGKLLASNSGVESPPEKSSPSGPDLNNSESLSANTNNSEIAPNSTDSLDDNDNHTNNKYIEYNGKLDFENVILKNGIAYDVQTGLPILPDMEDGFEHEYNYSSSVAFKSNVGNGIAWIIIFSCIILLAVMIIVITVVSCVRHRRNRRRRDENYSNETNFNDRVQ